MNERTVTMLVKYVKFDAPWTTVLLMPASEGQFLDIGIRGELTIASNKVGELDDYKVGRYAELTMRPLS